MIWIVSTRAVFHSLPALPQNRLKVMYVHIHSVHTNLQRLGRERNQFSCPRYLTIGSESAGYGHDAQAELAFAVNAECGVSKLIYFRRNLHGHAVCHALDKCILLQHWLA